MNSYENKIYVSYAWGGDSEELVNKIDESLQERGITIIRDKRDLGYKGSIKKFMKNIGKGLCIIVVISDKYLKSPNCMFELVEIAENKRFRNRIFPIVLSDANIYDPVKRLEYVKYWEDKRQDLANAMKTVDPANLQGIRDDIDDYHRFRAEISELTSTLKDMNTLTPEIHKGTNFSALYDSIEKHFHPDLPKESAVSSLKMDELSDDRILEKIAQLPGALFEILVFRFDKLNSIPGREAPQLIRATELIKLANSQKDGLENLRSEFQNLRGG